MTHIVSHNVRDQSRWIPSISSSVSTLLLGFAGGTISCSLDSVTSKGSTFSIVGLISNFWGAGVGGGGDSLDETSLNGLASWKRN